MAEEHHQSQQHPAARENEPGLKYLGFVQVAAMRALMFVSVIYASAKEHCGPLKPGVQSVEGAVKCVLRPVYDNFHDFPVQILKYVDRKVGESLTKLDSHTSHFKKSWKRSRDMVDVTDMIVKDLVAEVRDQGLVKIAKRTAKGFAPTAKELYATYEPMAEECAVSAWQKLNKLPLFPRVANNVVLPAAAFFTEKYNQGVGYTAERGYRVSGYLPLVPTEKISSIFVEKKA